MSKEYNTKPTEKQKLYAKNKLENGGNKYKSAKGANYSEAMATNPSKIENTKGFKQLLEIYFPDEFLFTEHKKNISQDKDRGAKNTALTSAYKLKDSYPKEQTDIDAGDLQITIRKK